MGPPPTTSPKRIGRTYKYYVTAFGESVLLAERDEVQRVAEAHEAVDVRLHVEDVATLAKSTDDATRPVVAP
ncbi:MAG TPA: hypothetical protein VGM27_08660 [Acidobacteriaceae bacterium]|jgi:hypothetical protein